MKLLLLLIFILSSFNVFCANWSETSVSLLRGNESSQFLADNRPVNEITFQHASGWNYGDNFMWLDLYDYFKSSESNIKSSVYGEWSPRISLMKTLNISSDSKGFVFDLLLSGTIEYGRSSSGQSRGYLYGVAIDLNIKGFDFFQYNFYRRDNPDLQGSTFQSTIAYRSRFNLTNKFKITWNAYIDIVHTSEGSRNQVRDHWHTAQQLLVDLGTLFGRQTDTFYTGVEFQYWSTKFGIVEFGSESNLKYMVMWVL